jgi:hypothetical protein
VSTRSGQDHRGPVKSNDERKNIAAKATELAGAGKVQNYLEVAAPK